MQNGQIRTRKSLTTGQRNWFLPQTPNLKKNSKLWLHRKEKEDRMRKQKITAIKKINRVKTTEGKTNDKLNSISYNKYIKI